MKSAIQSNLFQGTGDIPAASFATDDVLQTICDWRKAGHRAALITLVGIEGSAPRPLGAQMAVCETGESRGYISGGCLESSLVVEACAAMEAGENRTVRYGRGSKYLDIALPCGSAIDLYFDVQLPLDMLDDAVGRETKRHPFILATDLKSGVSKLEDGPADGTPIFGSDKDGVFYRPFVPKLRLTIAGKGPATVCLARLASAVGLDCQVFSPEEQTLRECEQSGAKAKHLATPDEAVSLPQDPWTALVLLFHEHEWEPSLLSAALEGQCFYIGALGSHRTHAARLETLAARGMDRDQLDRIKGPLGLFPQARSPIEIAVSVLADVVHEYGRHYPA